MNARIRIKIGNSPSVRGRTSCGKARAAPKVGRMSIGRYATTEDFGGAHGRDDEPMEDEEKIMAGRPDVNFPALLTKDVHGG